MPTYEYACSTCGDHLEVVQSFKDDALTTCPNCGGSLRKVFGSIGVVFKGSGFYKTDSRSSSKKAEKAEKKAATADSGSADSSSSAGSASKDSSGSSTPASTESSKSTGAAAAAS